MSYSGGKQDFFPLACCLLSIAYSLLPIISFTLYRKLIASNIFSNWYGVPKSIVRIFDAIFPVPYSLLPTPYSLLPTPCFLCYISYRGD
ncbi:MAG: hypothetical protein F6K56_19405 [Moorea sp. SIO3G5]|nr:hypothetical protein [Moorena sp. SIO3G5]